MHMNALLRWSAFCFWMGAHAAYAIMDCEDLPTPDARSVDAVAGRQLLAQGISLFESRKLDQAERALQASLFAGLPDLREKATAHKYLAFVYCTNKEWTRCDAAFGAALDSRPSFALEEYELQGTPWRDAYLKAQSKRGLRCGRTSPVQGNAPRYAIAEAMGFSLNSSVITAITPLMSAAASPPSHNSMSGSTSFARYRLRSENNLQLRVTPWANVNLNGKRLGVTPPLTEFRLPPGNHTIELTNPGFETVRKALKVDSDETITITHDFDAR